MAKIDDTPKPLQKVQTDMIMDIDQLSDMLQNDEIDIDQWERRMSEIMSKGAGESYRAGTGGGTITAAEGRSVAQYLNIQIAFLRNFADDIRSGGWIPAYRSRAQMYATATRTPFSMGDVKRQAGRPLALPSMPAEGTICHTNCKCRWEIETVSKAKNNYNAYWRLGTDDNCQTCVQRAADWSPVKIRGGGVATMSRIGLTPVIIPNGLFIDPRALTAVIKNTMESAAKSMKIDFKVTTQTWSNKPSFKIDRARDFVWYIGTSNDIYKFVSGGTRVRYAAMTPGFKAKTKVRVIGSGSGRGGFSHMSRKPLPGIKARNFDEEIAKKWSKILPRIVDRAIAAEVG